MEAPAAATFTLAYLVLTFCFVFPPTEFHLAGLTVQNLLGRWLGSEDAAFVQYHLRRGSGTLLAHAALPLGYYLGMCFAAPEKQLCNISQAHILWQTFFAGALLLLVLAGTFTYYWSREGWSHHPLVQLLSTFALPPHAGWWTVASAINTEFRRIDKFATGPPGARLIVTDSWIIKVTTYSFHVAEQRDVQLTVIDSRQQDLLPDASMPAQFLTIRVASANPHVKTFDIRLNSSEYGELQDKLHTPIRNVANVVIHQSLSDLFLETFSSLVERNPPYLVPSNQELDLCIGCMQSPANIKLLKNCQELHDGECQPCFCYPMWCLLCMGKWFASQQDQQHPETWLSSHVPCPTCRARFCILDVCSVQ
ncbi:E3 ubiquitin-protein ligase TM129 [Pantherophis guttatus]|uniref:E3 ubiquitin-protein ligase TM129 n=1 Tax=Pantherophis guttatus TaxID=94885 RepID=A0A6P9CTD1_PANGU|nr:E3 ubiquitin-protein ligase TM129 [Pantherophis guttatus]